MPFIDFRQLHLDFHNSPLIQNIGKLFDPELFVSDLKNAHVTSVTCFSRCHHGLIYHDTRFADLRHPGLTRDLLGEQIRACHGAGIQVPIYISVGWDHRQSLAHPEWLERDARGASSGPGPLEPGFDRKLCLGSPYVDFVAEQLAEVLSRFDCDGFFFDIVVQGDCLCRACLQALLADDKDPANPTHRRQHADQVLERFKTRIARQVREAAPEATLFFNAGHIGPGTPRPPGVMTHLELESLPGGHWGPLHFPLTMRFARGLGLPVVGLTSAFHGTWGDIGAPKTEAALEAECMQMLAQGAACKVGDQWLPEGRFHPGTLEVISQVMGRVEALEPFCTEARPLSEIGVLYPEAFAAHSGSPVDRAASGAMQILAERHHQFDFIDGQARFDRYRLLVVPDTIRVGPELGAELDRYLRGGGALLLSHLGGLSPDADRFALPEAFAECRGIAPVEPDYLLALPPLAAGLPKGPLVMKWRAMRTRPADGTSVLASVRLPPFERSRAAFFGHQQAPPDRDADYPAVLRKDRVIYFAHPIFSMYRKEAWPWCSRLVQNAIDLLLPCPLVRATAPRSCAITVLHQPRRHRRVVHLWHYPQRLVGERFPTVDEVLTIGPLDLALRCPAPPRRVSLEPQGTPLSCRFEAPYAHLRVPGLKGHQLVVVEDSPAP